MEILRANQQHLQGINRLLYQVHKVHSDGRPDIFKAGVKKYTDSELSEIIKDDSRPIFVAVDEGNVVGYAFCVFVQHENSNILTDVKTLYIDDLCVDENVRGKHIGKQLYSFVVDFAKSVDCYNITLNVWTLNESALKFYEKLGLKPQKIGMEIIL